MSDINELRNQMRAAIFNAKAAAGIVVKFFGTDLEVRTPTLGEVLETTEVGDKKQQTVEMMIKYCFIPGSDTRVFEEADKDSLLQLPFGEDMLRVQRAITKLTSVDVDSELGNSETTSEDSTS